MRPFGKFTAVCARGGHQAPLAPPKIWLRWRTPHIGDKNMALRRTKIVATLGPASSSPERIRALIRAGLDVARLNFSHGNADDHRQRAELVRTLAAEQGRFV